MGNCVSLFDFAPFNAELIIRTFFRISFHLGQVFFFQPKAFSYQTKRSGHNFYLSWGNMMSNFGRFYHQNYVV